MTRIAIDPHTEVEERSTKAMSTGGRTRTVRKPSLIFSKTYLGSTYLQRSTDF